MHLYTHGSLRLSTLFLLCLFGMTSLNAQSYSKTWIYEYGKQHVQEKIRKDVETIIQSGQFPSMETLNPDPLTQTLTTRGDEGQINSSDEPESELHAAVNPTDTNNIIVSAMKWSTGPLGADLTFPVYYTHDFGQSWTESTFTGTEGLGPFSIVAGGGDPILTFDADGTAYLSWLLLSLNLNLSIDIRLFWATSTDGGANWELQNTPIDEGELSGLTDPNGRFVDKQWMVTDLNPESDNFNTTYVAYAEINFQDTSYNILVKSKAAGANSFTNTPLAITDGFEFPISQFTSIDVDSEGRVHVIFAAAESATDQLNIYHSVSTDGAVSFSEPVVISPFNIPCFPPDPSGDPCPNPILGIDETRVYPCPHLKIDKSGGPYDGSLYVAWTADGLTNSVTEGTDIYFSRSTDGGATWSPALILNNDTDPITDQFFSNLTVSESGVLGASWYDRRDDPNNVLTHYYMTYSLDGGATFAQDMACSSEPADFSQIGAGNQNFGVGEYTQIVSTPNHLIPVWADGRTNDGNIDLYIGFVPVTGNENVSVQEISPITSKLSVQSPSPNPTTAISTLTFKLKETSKVELRVVDARGKELGIFMEGTMGIGTYEADLDLSTYPSGTYFYVLETDFGVKTGKVVKK
jgi:hypothetical protein